MQLSVHIWHDVVEWPPCMLAMQASADAIILFFPIHVIKVDPVAQIVELFGPKKYVCSCSRSHPGSYLA